MSVAPDRESQAGEQQVGGAFTEEEANKKRQNREEGVSNIITS